jgi:hypothetical protein
MKGKTNVNRINNNFNSLCLYIELKKYVKDIKSLNKEQFQVLINIFKKFKN